MRLKFTCPVCGGHEFSTYRNHDVRCGCDHDKDLSNPRIAAAEKWRHFSLHPESHDEFVAMVSARVGQGAYDAVRAAQRLLGFRR